ncbi:MAG TPA: hypothetical protein VJQ84_08450 [Solirubrobacterales bacterium]|nr:hypothetical protein [Solirubrobacterales bacterium]
MKAYLKLSAVIGVLALVVPAIALATPGNGQGQGQGNGNGQGQGPEYNPTPPTSTPPQGQAYGKYCQGESKKHVKGEKGTAFSRCVTNVAHAAQHPNQAPGQVCKGESKKHVKGEKGTAYSRCVKAAAKLRHDERKKEREEQSA